MEHFQRLKSQLDVMTSGVDVKNRLDVIISETDEFQKFCNILIWSIFYTLTIEMSHQRIDHGIIKALTYCCQKIPWMTRDIIKMLVHCPLHRTFLEYSLLPEISIEELNTEIVRIVPVENIKVIYLINGSKFRLKF